MPLCLTWLPHPNPVLVFAMALLLHRRTFDPDEADFFYVPAYTACYINPVYAQTDYPW